ncbi:MAG: threonine/serine exporter family protein [Candidatus Cohnella colombiensis]|uniref:Threonine/serine exporter family protein n=1 Tax=Candidatus Cohnella colombiensis TaxID=3121368 RepID=A0AA95EYC0_9BACL|nr:MAG: threonine/serine exporter family protein [Cohnella sp.]
MEWLYQAVCGFIATMGIAVTFKAPQKSLIHVGLVGAIGWMTYYILIQAMFDAVPASFAGAFAVAILAHALARLYKMPMTVFSVAGIIPLVPGGLAYEAMRAIVLNKYLESLQFATRAGILTGAIVMGLVFAEVFFQLINSLRQKSQHPPT